MKKTLLTILILSTSIISYSQCATVAAGETTLISGSGSGTTADPYAGGSVIEYCVTATQYSQAGTNWIHSVIPSGFPAGTTFSPKSTPVVGQGDWLWIDSSTDPNFLGPGWYFDRNTTDGNPFNNFGHTCTTCNFEFCFEATLPSVATMYSPQIDINGDGTTGNWTNNECDDPPVTPPGWPAEQFLPVKWSSFDVSIIQEQHLSIEWATESEIDVDRFVVEAQKNHNEWVPISIVAPKGINTLGAEYKLFYPNPPFGISYYRVKSVDIDDSEDYTDIKSAEILNKSEWEIVQNPVMNHLTFIPPNHIDWDEVHTISIFSLTGKILSEHQLESLSNTNSISVSELDQGLYFIRFMGMKGNSTTMKFFKQ